MAAYSASLEDVKTAVLGLLVILQVGLCPCGRARQPAASSDATLQGHVSRETWALPGSHRAAWCDLDSSSQCGELVRATGPVWAEIPQARTPAPSPHRCGGREGCVRYGPMVVGCF